MISAIKHLETVPRETMARKLPGLAGGLADG